MHSQHVSKTVDIVIPVYNEEHVLARSVSLLRRFLQDNLSHHWTIVIADNASIDGTYRVAQELAQVHPDVRPFHLDLKGRGRALRAAWQESDADIVSYMDVDLSTSLQALPPLIAAIADDGYDIAIGSRLLAQSRVQRSFRREFISRCYNLIIYAMFHNKFYDAQCGFKALSRRAVQEIIPLVENNAWFFDTELLLLAEMKGYRIKEVPVEWIEDPDSRVHIQSTAIEDLKGLWRVRFSSLR